MRYVQELRIERSACTLDTLDDILEAVRQYGAAELVPNASDPDRPEKIRVIVEADDLWDMYEQCEMVKDELDAYEYALADRFVIEKANLVDA